MRQRTVLLVSVGLLVCFIGSAVAQEHAKSEKGVSASSTAPVPTANTTETHDGASSTPAAKAATDERMARLEGEKRFRTNCGRCHMAPHKFPPRIMATAIRHMRVRAMITDEDMRLILQYMTR